MAFKTLKSSLLTTYLALLLFLGFSTGIMGFVLFQNNAAGRLINQAKTYLHTTEKLLQKEMERINLLFTYSPYGKELKEAASLDYLFDLEEPAESSNEIVRFAFEQKRAVSGFRRITEDELQLLGKDWLSLSTIFPYKTPFSRDSKLTPFHEALVLECAYFNPEDNRGYYGGRLINRNAAFIESLMNTLFAKPQEASSFPGAMAIYLNDICLASSLKGSIGTPSYGHIVQEEIYDRIFINSQEWTGRSFIENDRYFTAGRPVKNIHGVTLGLLVLGISEKEFSRNFSVGLIYFLSLFGLTLILFFMATLFQIKKIEGSIINLIEEVTRITQEGGGTIECKSCFFELSGLIGAINTLVSYRDHKVDALGKIGGGEQALNPASLELIGFVTHELKGILSSTMLNAYAVRDGYLGMVNFKQRKALDSLTRNLEYLSGTVNNFLNLSRLEKNELTVTTHRVWILEDLIHFALENFRKEIDDKRMVVKVNIAEDIPVFSDQDLLRIVINNILGNAVKYGILEGLIEIDCKDTADEYLFSIYNEGSPLSKQELSKVFDKFYRSKQNKRIKGTGLGLFITARIVEKLGGRIEAKAEEGGNRFLFTIRR